MTHYKYLMEKTLTPLNIPKYCAAFLHRHPPSQLEINYFSSGNPTMLEITQDLRFLLESKVITIYSAYYMDVLHFPTIFRLI